MKNLLILVIYLFLFNLVKSQNWSPLGEGIPYMEGPRVIYADSLENYLYAGGNMHYESNGRWFNSIARWNGSYWDTLGSGIIGSGNVLAIERYNGELYVGGAFSYAGGKSARNIAIWSGNNWDTLLVQPFANNSDAAIWAMKKINNKLYIGGQIYNVSGIPCYGVAEWDGNNWHGIDFPNLQWFVSINAIAEFNGEMYVAGSFCYDLNDTINNILRWDGISWHSVNGGLPGISTYIQSMVVYNSELYIGGYFFIAEGNKGNFI